MELELVMTSKPGTKSAPNVDMLDAIQMRLAHAVRDLREAAQSGLAADQAAALKIADKLSQIVDEMPRKPPVKIAS